MRRAPALAFLLLSACAPKTPEPSADQLALGERAYQKCYSCHALEARRNLAGPSLYRIVNRPVAAEPGFDYSPAMRRFALKHPRWERQLLDRFAEDPEALVPRTSMAFHGMPDPAEREALILYLGKRQTSASAASLP